MVADRPQPWLIMHRAAESRRRLAAALQSGALQSGALRSGADFVEVDLRLGARVECRHDALVVPWLPLLTQRHLLPRVRLRRLWLEEIRPPARLFLDFKEDDPRLVEQSVDTMRRSGLLSTAAASTPYWRLLDRLAAIAPGVERYYSVGRKQTQRWEAYRARLAGGEAGGRGIAAPQPGDARAAPASRGGRTAGARLSRERCVAGGAAGGGGRGRTDQRSAGAGARVAGAVGESGGVKAFVKAVVKAASTAARTWAAKRA